VGKKIDGMKMFVMRMRRHIDETIDLFGIETGGHNQVYLGDAGIASAFVGCAGIFAHIICKNL
jgi:hypothetical protein